MQTSPDISGGVCFCDKAACVRECLVRAYSVEKLAVISVVAAIWFGLSRFLTLLL
jgi:hypothetical protein